MTFLEALASSPGLLPFNINSLCTVCYTRSKVTCIFKKYCFYANLQRYLNVYIELNVYNSLHLYIFYNMFLWQCLYFQKSIREFVFQNVEGWNLQYQARFSHCESRHSLRVQWELPRGGKLGGRETLQEASLALTLESDFSLLGGAFPGSIFYEIDSVIM